MLKDAVVLSSKLPSAMDARSAFESGTATLEHCWVLLVDALTRQRSDIAASYWKEFEARTTGTPGLTRIRLMYLQQTRRLEAYHRHLLAMANTLRTTPGEVDYSRAIELMQFSQQAALAPQERKEVLDALEPVLRRQSGIQKPMLQWYQNMLTVYDALGQPEKALEVCRILAEQNSDQSYNHTQYAQRLVQQGQVNSAIQYLREALPQHPNWSGSDIQNIHSTIARFLWQERRLDALIYHVESLEPSQVSTQTWSIYLSALIAHNEYEKAMAWMQKQVEDVIQGNRSPEAVAAYLAAINRLSGNGYDHYTNRVTEKNSRTLKEIALQLLPLENTLDLIRPIVTDYRFKRSAHAEALWKEMYAMLQAQVEEGSPEKITSLIQWLKGAGFQPDQEDGWDNLMERLFIRWEQSEGNEASTLTSSILTYGGLDLQLKVASINLQRAETPIEKQSATEQLFGLLLQKPWSDEVMDELRTTVAQLELSTQESIHSHTRKWIDWVVNSRQTHLISHIENRQQLSRRELDEATQSVEKENTLWVVKWLHGQEINPPQPEMKRWIQLDRAYYQVLTETDLPAIETEGLALLRDLLTQSADTPTPTDKIVINRWVGILSNIAVKTSNDSADSLPLMTLLKQADQKDSFEMDWKSYIYQLLLALDRGDEVEAFLKKWYSSDDLELKIQWGNAYAMILAERNQIENAVEIFESLKAENVLGYQDYRTLSDWYTVLDKRELAQQSKRNAWNELQEYEIYNWLTQEVNRLSSSPATEVPEELNPEIPDAFSALFRKSVNPGNYLWLLQRFYTSTRDFRLLAAVVESTIGQSQQGIYNYLGSMHQVLNLLQEEATLDKMLDQMETLRTQDLTPTDQRALHLLSFMISYQAAKQAQGATPHIDRAYDALQQAFKGGWAEGEAAQMATLLGGLGALTPEKLAVEQQRQLNSLRNQVPKGSRDQLIISRYFAGVLWASN
ncbi:MAG: hypothetical protein PF795_05795, partial [Kiritimatiellae bacterium]|nr:hypothetical protein [Kiritimatiellia bacterium]